MGNVTLFTEPSGAYYFFRDDILAHIAAEQDDEYLYILPVNRAVRYFKKHLLDHCNRPALIDPPVYTFNTLIRKLYSKRPSAKQIIPASLRLIYINRLLEQHKDEFQYLKLNKNSSSGLVNKTSRMLSEMSQFGIRPGNFTEPPLSAEVKYKDLTKLLILLSDLYGESYIDESMLFSDVANTLNPDDVKSLFPGLKRIFINGYGIYTPPMVEIIKKLSDYYDISIQLEYDSDNEALFSHTYNAFDALKSLASDITTGGKEKSTLHKYLFRSEKPVEDHEKFDEEFNIRSVTNRVEEVNFIAASIRDFYQKNNLPLHRIAVTFPDLEKYAPLIRKTFNEFSIPFNLSTGYRLSQSPLVQAYLQILTLRISNFEVGEMGKLLLSPFLSPDLRININQYSALIKKYQIKRISSSWLKKITENESEIQESEQEIWQKITDICKIISHLDQAGSANDFPVIYLETLDRLGMLQWIKREDTDLSRANREREFRTYNRFYKLLNQIALIKQIQNLNLKDFKDMLQLVIREATYNLREWSNYGVQCMPRLEVQSLESDVLFIGGLVEGDFPRALKRDIFFDDEERDHLGLYAVEDLLAQDRFLFHQLLSSPAKQKFLLYPSYENETVLIPSSFIRSLTEVTSVEVTQIEEPPDFYLNHINSAEYLTEIIKTEFSQTETHKINEWLSTVHPENLKYILDVIANVYEKYRRTGFNSFEGNLSSNLQVINYLNQRVQKNTFSITALELYAFCPMKYFLQRILKLPDEEEVEETFSAMERGALIHQILFEFYNLLKQKNQHDTPWQYRELLTNIAIDQLDKMPYAGLAWTLEKENILGSAETKGLLHRLMEVERDEMSEFPYHPTFFELGFGLYKNESDTDQHSIGQPLEIVHGKDVIKLSGKIDRIDVDKNNRAFVIDYKTGKGKNAAIRDIYEGTSLQLPVYIAALAQLMPKYQSVAGLYYQIHDAENCKRIVAVSDGDEEPGLIKRGHGKLPNSTYPFPFEELISIANNHVITHVEKMSKGHFNHTVYPDSEGCQSYCSFRRICRKDVGKLKAVASEEKE